jgi:hypothetical protein
MPIAAQNSSRDIHLRADWHGKHQGTEMCAIHGLILASGMGITELTDPLVAMFDAGSRARRQTSHLSWSSRNSTSVW